jgi:protein-tyrosine phosphatase
VVVDRWLDLTGNDNARDLGGLPVAGDGTTRLGVMIRSDTLQELTPTDVRQLVDGYGLRTVIDLRTPLEAEREGRGLLADQPVEYHNLPFVPDAYVVVDHPGHDLIVADRTEQERASHYLGYLDVAPKQVADALKVLAAPGGTPAIFHCAAGKDRTGVLAALLLEIAGVDREAVIDDYAQTNERLAGVEARLSRLPTYGAGLKARDLADIQCDPDTMRDVLGRLDETYGGAAGWATEHGVTDDEIAALRALLT